MPFCILACNRAPDKDHSFTSIMPFFSPNPMFDHLLESSYRDDSNKCSNIGFDEEITQAESIEVYFAGLIWCSDAMVKYHFKLSYCH